MCFILNLQKKIIHGTFSRLEIFQKAYGPKEMPCWPPFLILKRKGIHEVRIHRDKYLLTRPFLASMATSCIVGE